jgi:hypothetical protein
MSDTNLPERAMTKEALLNHIRSAYEELERILLPLSEARLAQPGKDGWAVKDHLAHLAAWELGIVRLLRRRRRFEGARLEEAVRQRRSEEEVNEIIYQEHAGLSPAQALALYRNAHRQMLDVLESLANEDLFQSYAAYLPEGEEGPSAPVLNWITGNTYEHYAEHSRWIQELLASQA